MTRIFRYVLAADTGMAPRVERGLLSLATCKPMLRRSAAEGDWVIGCFPAPHNELVAWAGVIAETLPIGIYGMRHGRRADALYPAGPDGGPVRRTDRLPDYHPDAAQQRQDRSGKALLFDRTRCWYFGGDGRGLPPELAHLAPRGQGHRVNGTSLDDAPRLEAWLRGEAPPGIHGTPRDGWYRGGGGRCGPAASPPSRRPGRPPRSRPC
jgi:hypothetical protein